MTEINTFCPEITFLFYHLREYQNRNKKEKRWKYFRKKKIEREREKNLVCLSQAVLGTTSTLKHTIRSYQLLLKPSGSQTCTCILFHFISFDVIYDVWLLFTRTLDYYFEFSGFRSTISLTLVLLVPKSNENLI